MIAGRSVSRLLRSHHSTPSSTAARSVPAHPLEERKQDEDEGDERGQPVPVQRPVIFVADELLQRLAERERQHDGERGLEERNRVRGVAGGGHGCAMSARCCGTESAPGPPVPAKAGTRGQEVDARFAGMSGDDRTPGASLVAVAGSSPATGEDATTTPCYSPSPSPHPDKPHSPSR
jgi:hypothetical protein